MEKWKAVPDEVVRHVWQCQEDDCEYDNPTAYISPEWYQNNGTPVCECDQDMTYLRTEVVDSSEGEDGDLAFVETIPTDEIPKLFEKEKISLFDGGDGYMPLEGFFDDNNDPYDGGNDPYDGGNNENSHI